MARRIEVIPVVGLMQHIRAVVDEHKFSYATEARLQEELAALFAEKRIPHVREHDLGAHGRIDFFIDGRVGLEVKIKGGPSGVTRQLIRYADCPSIEGLILITGRSSLRSLPSTLLSKPFMVGCIWEGFL